MRSRTFTFPYLLITMLAICACQATSAAAPIASGEPAQNDKCGDGICEGPENPANCPADCASEKETDPEDSSGSPVLYLGMMVHLEGWKDEAQNEERFNQHVSLMREYASLFETYGAKLTWESKEVTEGVIQWGDNVLKEMEERGHGIGVHADTGGQRNYDCSQFNQDLFVKKKQLESLGVTVRHASGVVSHCDWVAAMLDAGYEFTTGMVAYGVMSLPEEMRPQEYRDCPNPSSCHDVYPEALEERIHPWRMNSGLDWIEHDPAGKLVMLPASNGLACFDEARNNSGCDQDFSQADIDLFFQELDQAIAIIDPGQVNMYYVGWSLGKALDKDLMEAWLQRIQPYVAAGKVEWKTLPEMYDAYLAWEK